MKIIDIPTERTTAATDLIIASLSTIIIFYIYKHRRSDNFKARIWISVFVFLFLSCILGAVAHGLDWTPSTRRLFWQPLNLCLGLLVALFVVGAAYDHWGRRVAICLLPIMSVVGVLFFLITTRVHESFIWFVMFQALAMVFVLGIYMTDVIVNRSRGSMAIAAGILLSIIAALLQSIESIRFTLIWRFDNNGAYHLVQSIGIIFIAYGLNTSLCDTNPKG